MPVPADPHPAFQDYAHPERVVSASWLSARIGVPGLRIVESDEDSLLYDIGHIPTAVRIDWQRDLNDPITRDFIDGAGFAALMRSKGISRDDTVVVYGDKSNGWAAYTLWVFQLFGHKDVRLLDGGRDAWMAEERDTSFTVPSYPPSDYPVVERNDDAGRAFVEEVLGAACSAKTMLIDVRGIDHYTGEIRQLPTQNQAEKSALRAGHIPTAINIAWENAVYPNNNFRGHAELERQYHSLDPAQPTIVYSHLGDRSAHTWFVLKYLLGFQNVRNYDGSWAEWGNMIRIPITIGGES